MRRRAKIVCTLGPATATPESVLALVRAGMDVARLNLSHGSRADHASLYAHVRRASDETGRAVGILVDLQGPKIRLGTFAGGAAVLEDGATFTLTTEDVAGDTTIASTSYAALPADVRPGDTVLVDDGNVKLRVEATDGTRVRCTVIEGGRVSDHKGINLPGVRVSAPSMTAKDRDDLRFAMSLRVDLLALSFVRDSSDIREVHAIMDEFGARLPVIAKIEKPEAVAALEEIVQVFDGLMVARGDLGVEIPLEQVPLVQKRAVQLAREYARPVIVATQMLESMLTRSRPTRAEASDVANAVLDGADALMLSGETSVGEWPIEAVETMSRIIGEVERASDFRLPRLLGHADSLPQALAAAAVQIAGGTGAKALAAFTASGASARLLAAHRCRIPLLAFTTDVAVRSRLALQWGIETFVVPPMHDTDEMVRGVERSLLELGRVAPGDHVVIVAGTPPGAVGSTNTVRVHRIGGA
jgi:pyruvate kinase